MDLLLVLAFVIHASVSALALNDWNKPCFHGECAYDVLGVPGRGSGTIRLHASPGAITDITPAAGWVILDCDPNALAQDIRLVCKSDDMSTAGCAHLFDYDGPVDKIVRLPESCGLGPFVRISQSRIAHDQSIPGHLKGSITRRDGAIPQVYVLSVDTDFASVSKDRGGVRFDLVASSLHLHPGRFNDLFNSKRSQASWFDDAWNQIKNEVANLYHSIRNATSFEYDKSQLLAKYTFPTKTLKLLDPPFELDCGPARLSVGANVTVKGHVTPYIGFVAEGNFPSFSRMGVHLGISGEADARLKAIAHLTGSKTFTTEILPVTGIPPFEIPGIITLGPAVKVDAKIQASLDVNMEINVGANFKLNDVDFYFPRSAGESKQDIVPKDTPLTLNAGVSLTGTAVIEAHVIPKVILGIQAFGAVKADVFVDLDTYAKLTLEAKGQASASANIGTRSPDHQVIESSSSYMPPYGALRDLHQRDGSAGFSGRVSIAAGLALEGGAEGAIPGIIDQGVSYPLWSHEWEIFSKSYPSTPSRRMVSDGQAEESVKPHTRAKAKSTKKKKTVSPKKKTHASAKPSHAPKKVKGTKKHSSKKKIHALKLAAEGEGFKCPAVVENLLGLEKTKLKATDYKPQN